MTAEPLDLLSLALRRPLTVADLPEDDPIGRIELIEGELLVTPGADIEHQCLVDDIWAALRSLAPAPLRVLSSPNVIAGDSTLVMPEVAVVDLAHQTAVGLGVEPKGLMLAVEITSRSTRGRDLLVKRDLYARWNVPYLLVDRQVTPYRRQVFGNAPEWAGDLTREL